MYTAELLDHFRNPRNCGTLPPPAVVVDVSNPACGDTLRLSVVWQDGQVEHAAFQCRGCTAAIALGSAVTVWLHGRDAAELAAFDQNAAAGLVGELPAASGHAAILCRDAVRAVLRSSPTLNS